ncbi:MAG: glutamate synthase subunit beta [Planctomycetota bacterium]|jgi:glutamate synthase (NADPH/NADH) small chain
MAKDRAFIEIDRKTAEKIPVSDRLKNYQEIYREMADDEIKWQASRCMDCGVPFCHNFGCPLGNVVPEWNELIYQGRWKEALDLLHTTNNFPEITGRICPALCESACTLSLGGNPASIRQTELNIIEKGFKEGWVESYPPVCETGKSIAVIGSGPAGLAAAQQLRRAGHKVVVFEKNDKPGGILRYGIPDFKLEKHIIDRRVKQLEDEGVRFENSIEVGVDISAGYLLKRFAAVCLCVGAEVPRDLPVPGRELKGIHFAMDYLVQQNLLNDGYDIPEADRISAAGKEVIVIGGGDTGSDCLGTALRQGAKNVIQMEIMPKPPEDKNTETPWPEYPAIHRTSSSHEEGGQRLWSVCTSEFTGDQCVSGLTGSEVKWVHDSASGRRNMEIINGSEFEMKADLVILAMGFTQPVHDGLLDGLGVDFDDRGNVSIEDNHQTSAEKVFAAGDSAIGPSLVVRCIAAGRQMAREVDIFLMGESSLPEVM